MLRCCSSAFRRAVPSSSRGTTTLPRYIRLRVILQLPPPSAPFWNCVSSSSDLSVSFAVVFLLRSGGGFAPQPSLGLFRRLWSGRGLMPLFCVFLSPGCLYVRSAHDQPICPVRLLLLPSRPLSAQYVFTNFPRAPNPSLLTSRPRGAAAAAGLRPAPNIPYTFHRHHHLEQVPFMTGWLETEVWQPTSESLAPAPLPSSCF